MLNLKFGQDVEVRSITRAKEGNFIMIKGSIHQEDITILIPQPLQYTKQKMIQPKWESQRDIIIDLSK